MKEIKKVFNYDPNTGHFIRLRSRRGDLVGKICNSCNAYGYIRIQVNGKRYLAHRLAWLYMMGIWPKNQIDHINGIKDDNRWCNLREATQSENNYNSIKRKDNSSGYRGVTWHKKDKKWQAQICVNKKYIFLGQFSSKEDAAKVYSVAAKKNFGSFLRLNV